MGLVIVIPLSIAIVHPGFPVSDVRLTARDVWVTNSEQVLAGRLNRQIDELNGSLRPASGAFDVLQDGDSVFLHDIDNSTIERIEPELTLAVQTTSVPAGSQLAYGGNRMSVLAPDGRLWVLDVSSDIQFDASLQEPVTTLGEGSRAVVTTTGEVIAASPSLGRLVRVPVDGSAIAEHAQEIPARFELTVVGDRPVILDRDSGDVILADGKRVDVPGLALRLQQPGAEAPYVLVATGDSLVRVRFDGAVSALDSGSSITVTSENATSAPVHVGECDYAAWAGAQLALASCGGAEPSSMTIPAETVGDRVEFRVNRTVVVLNNFRNGDAFLIDDNMKLVDNWQQVIPPEEEDSQDTDEKSLEQNFTDAILERSATNHPPAAADDSFGVRPGRSTVFPVLANDSDQDGDVLTITQVGSGYESAGTVDLIDGGRALQFTPAPSASGAVSFRYTVSDGRPGGVAEATVTATMRGPAENTPPTSFRSAGVSVELGQSVGYNVLADWLDPDGDDLVLEEATSASGDEVRFSPDGYVTFRSTNGELGPRDVQFTVSDGTQLTATGTLVVTVGAPGTLEPIGTPDFATTFMGRTVEIKPLANDVSRSGASLGLQAVEAETAGGQVISDPDQGIVSLTASAAGTYYVKYTVAAGALTGLGMIRVDVVEDPADPQPPIAVKDPAYLRGNETTTIDPLQNDVSPGGRVLGIQTVTVPPQSSSLHVEVLGNTLLRISASPPITTQTQFTYTISDGLQSSSATVTVVPVDPLVTAQAPVAVDDAIKVRAGDVASVLVLENDYSPDKTPFTLDPELLDAGSAGLAFVTRDQVRFQAPAEPGSYSVVYGVSDDYGQQATARVTFAVLPADDENAPPTPRTLTARVFSGSEVTVSVPLDGIDPNGDSVTLLPFTSSMEFGDVIGITSTSFTYQAFADKVGTDTFTYRVVDARGEQSFGQVRIGVIPRAGEDMQPIAVNDEVVMRPDRTASVNVLENDSDPNGYAISIANDSLSVPAGISAEIVKTDNNQRVEVVAEREGSFNITYGLTNGKGGTASALITVVVSATAPAQHPTAVDHVLEQKEFVENTNLTIDVREGAENPGGRVKDLEVTLEGPNAARAQVRPDGSVVVTPGATRVAIAYRLTNTIDDVSATAFIIVPPAPGPGFDDPPIIDPDLEPQVVRADEVKEWKLSDILLVPSGRQAILIGPTTTSATRSNGAQVYKDATTLTYTPEPGYRGQASLSFDVTDGSSPSDPTGNTNSLKLIFTVGNPDLADVPPTFTTPNLVVAAAGATEFNLRDATAHPNPAILSQVTYSDLGAAGAGVSASLSGSILSLSAERSAEVGSTFSIPVTVQLGSTSVQGTVNVRVVSSLEPLAQTVVDSAFAQRGSTAVVDVLANDQNPFPDESLTIVNRTLENLATGAAVGGTGSAVSVSTNPTFTGDVAVIYRVQDATRDSTREVNGRLVVTVWDAPDRLAVPSYIDNGDGSVTFSFQPPTSNNGSTITGYTVSNTAGVGTPCADPRPGVPCAFTGLVNGTSYSFSVVAHGAVPGSSLTNQSEPSAALTATPYATPTPPAGASASNGAQGSGRVNLDWSPTSNLGGGGADYQWRTLPSGSWTSVGGGTFHVEPAIGVGNSASFAVRVCNSGGKCSSEVATGSAYAPPAPPSAAMYLGNYYTTYDPAQCSSANCRFYSFTTANFPAGIYTVQCLVDGAQFFQQNNVSIGASGQHQLQCFLGDTNQQASVRILNVNGSDYTSPSITWGW